MKSIVPVSDTSDFTLDNIPFGVFHLNSEQTNQARCGTALGDFVVDLAELEKKGNVFGKLFEELAAKNMSVFNQPHLNHFMELSREHWRAVRSGIQNYFQEPNHTKTFNAADFSGVLHPMSSCTMLLPCRIGDYTDFYSSKNHAYNVGCMFRGPDNALQPNWVWLPVGYHGRSSSVVISGTNVTRPKGQFRIPTGAGDPTFITCKKFDFELEMGAFYGGASNGLGNRLEIKNAEDHIFGLCLLNDWSCRDLQVWEYVPLGPFTAKNMGTVISPWIVTMDALEPFRCKLPEQDPKPLEYLQDPNYSSYDISLKVNIVTPDSTKEQLQATSNQKYQYWSIAQQLTHHAVTGCNMVAGDLLGSGTISGPVKAEYGSLLELSWNGKEEIELENGEKMTFLPDNHEIVFYGSCEKDGKRIGFGECRSKLLPVKE